MHILQYSCSKNTSVQNKELIIKPSTLLYFACPGIRSAQIQKLKITLSCQQNPITVARSKNIKTQPNPVVLATAQNTLYMIRKKKIKYIFVPTTGHDTHINMSIPRKCAQYAQNQTIIPEDKLRP